MNELLTANETAQILKIHINTVYFYLETAKITGHRIIGNRWRIKQEDLEVFINEHGARQDNAELSNKNTASGTVLA